MYAHLLSLFFALSSLFGILTFLLLLFRQEDRKHSSTLLAFYILIFVLFTVHNLLLEEKAMLGFPYLYRITKPLMYSVPVMVYLYVRANVFSEVGPRKGDWIFFLPTMLHFVELLPFYFMPVKDKAGILQLFYQNMDIAMRHNEGILPSFLHPALMFIYCIMLYAACYRMLSRARVGQKRMLDPQNMMLLVWLRFFVTVNLVHTIVLGIHFLTFRKIPVSTFLINNVESAFILLSTGIALFFQPALLYGFRATVSKTAGEGNGVGKNVSVSQSHVVIPEEKRRDYVQKIREHLEKNKPYVQTRYSLKDMSEELKIPYTYLSHTINQEFGQNFNELINSYRVGFVLELMKMPEAGSYTLEALSKQAGFASRATFSRAFFHVTGSTPSDHFKKNNHSNGQ